MVDAFNIGRHLVALTNETQVPRQTALYLLEHGLPGNTPVLVCEYMTMEDEKVYRTTLSEVPKTEYRLTSVMVVKNPGIAIAPCA